jgi:membrane protease YdiL (CAAX protease family)
MKLIIKYITAYFKETDKVILLFVSALTACLVFLNFHFLLDDLIRKENNFWIKLLLWFGVFLTAFALPYLFVFYRKSERPSIKSVFWLILLIAPAMFSMKLSLSFSLPIIADSKVNYYWNQVFYWPILLILFVVPLFLIWKYTDFEQPFYGFKTNGIKLKPYFTLLIVMIPLLIIASTQADFLATYPKLKSAIDLKEINSSTGWLKTIIYELSYGSDFISIELFFRGFLILAFIKWVGKDAILPMACFYCTIHFGKPLGECISSYFGGILLGIVVYNTRSIWGGLVVHLGIAWLMEVGGYIGNQIYN